MREPTGLAPTVMVDIVLRTSGPGGELCSLPTTFAYSTADPYAVTLTFETGADPVTWIFARDLLLCGMYAPSGQGDVFVWPAESPSGEGVVEGTTAEIAEFAHRMVARVPVGQETLHIDMDAELSAELHH